MGVAGNDTLLAATIDVGEDGAAVDGDGSLTRTCHRDPVGASDVDIALAGAIDVAGAGVEDGAVIVVHGPEAGVLVADTLIEILVYRHVVGELGRGTDSGSRSDFVDGGVLDVDGGGAGMGHEDAVVVPPADAGHLAAAEDRAADSGIADNVDAGVHDTAGEDVIVVVDVALARAHDVAHAPVALEEVGVAGVADGAAEDTNSGHAVVDGVVNASLVILEE